MNSIDSKIIGDESTRLESLGIQYDHIHCSDGKPVVTVDGDTMAAIICKRESGNPLDGLFISTDGKHWTASILDESGHHHHRTGLTECRAYRWVLGYPIGHYKRNFRYVGQPSYRNRRKNRRNSNTS